MFLHVFEGDPIFFLLCARVFEICVGGECMKGRIGGHGSLRCLKSVGLTGLYKTVWLMESFGKSSPAVLMNLEPKGLMKRAPFAKTVPQLDLS